MVKTKRLTVSLLGIQLMYKWNFNEIFSDTLSFVDALKEIKADIGKDATETLAIKAQTFIDNDDSFEAFEREMNLFHPAKTHMMI